MSDKFFLNIYAFSRCLTGFIFLSSFMMLILLVPTYKLGVLDFTSDNELIIVNIKHIEAHIEKGNTYCPSGDRGSYYCLAVTYQYTYKNKTYQSSKLSSSPILFRETSSNLYNFKKETEEKKFSLINKKKPSYAVLIDKNAFLTLDSINSNPTSMVLKLLWFGWLPALIFLYFFDYRKQELNYKKLPVIKLFKIQIIDILSFIFLLISVLAIIYDDFAWIKVTKSNPYFLQMIFIVYFVYNSLFSFFFKRTIGEVCSSVKVIDTKNQQKTFIYRLLLRQLLLFINILCYGGILVISLVVRKNIIDITTNTASVVWVNPNRDVLSSRYD